MDSGRPLSLLLASVLIYAGPGYASDPQPSGGTFNSEVGSEESEDQKQPLGNDFAESTAVGSEADNGQDPSLAEQIDSTGEGRPGLGTVLGNIPPPQPGVVAPGRSFENQLPDLSGSALQVENDLFGLEEDLTWLDAEIARTTAEDPGSSRLQDLRSRQFAVANRIDRLRTQQRRESGQETGPKKKDGQLSGDGVSKTASKLDSFKGMFDSSNKLQAGAFQKSLGSKDAASLDRSSPRRDPARFDPRKAALKIRGSDPSRPQTRKELLLAAAGPYKGAASRLGLKFAPEAGGRIVGGDGRSATPHQLDTLRREIEKEPRALLTRPDYFEVVDRKDFEGLKQTYTQDPDARQTDLIDMGPADVSFRDFAWQRSCGKISGDCNPHTKEESYKVGEFVSPEDLDAAIKALEEGDATSAEMEYAHKKLKRRLFGAGGARGVWGRLKGMLSALSGGSAKGEEAYQVATASLITGAVGAGRPALVDPAERARILSSEAASRDAARPKEDPAKKEILDGRRRRLGFELDERRRNRPSRLLIWVGGGAFFFFLILLYDWNRRRRRPWKEWSSPSQPRE